MVFFFFSSVRPYAPSFFLSFFSLSSPWLTVWTPLVLPVCYFRFFILYSNSGGVLFSFHFAASPNDLCSRSFQPAVCDPPISFLADAKGSLFGWLIRPHRFLEVFFTYVRHLFCPPALGVFPISIASSFIFPLLFSFFFGARPASTGPSRSSPPFPFFSFKPGLQ